MYSLMCTDYVLIGLRTIFPVSTRGPGDMVPRSSTMASVYETPLLPRLETMLGAITKAVLDVEGDRVDASPCDGITVPDDKWECIVSLVFRRHLYVKSVLGPILVVRRDDEELYYVNVGLGLLRLERECIVKYIEAAEKLWENLREVDVKKKYALMNEYRMFLEELSNNPARRPCIISPYSIFATGISLDNISKSTRHGLIYSYVLRDFAELTTGKNYVVGLLVEVEEKPAINKNIYLSLGPRGRPAILVKSDIEDQVIDIIGREKIAITPLPLKLAENVEVLVHPLKPKPLIIQLAKSTLVNGKWAKTGVEPAYQAGVVAVNGTFDCRVIRGCGSSLILYYAI